MTPLTGPLPPGTPAPEFSLAREDGTKFTRADLEGRTTVLEVRAGELRAVLAGERELRRGRPRWEIGRASCRERV